MAAFFSQALRALPNTARNNGDYADIRSMLNSGQANDAITALKKILAANPQDAQANNLLCRVHFQEQLWQDAAHACEAAVQAQFDNSEFHDWLGRAYGEQAEHASMFNAYGIAKKVHSEFETAVQLDAKNTAALADLGEFTVEAPSVLGGGLDKAQGLAEKMKPLDAGKYHELLAQIAIKSKDNAAAERELKLATVESNDPAQAWMNLASFYGKENNFPVMEQAVQHGIAVDTKHSSALVDGASTLMKYKHNLPLAETMLRQYLTSSNQTEDAPVFRVYVQLGELLNMQGQEQAAQQQYAIAKALASGYAAANWHSD
ncbi:MAG TPA: tetratricopeptide repeat protein [Acidobacteriaceae bacterium]|nr:tetratricopeptide repeat protein [Acidobacteriaceae bacterium]